MALTVGTRLGPYEVLSPLGAGGMGEVYRAHDTRLDRDVAIKVLPAAAVGTRDALARFEREARALAALNHPNIAQVFGLEDAAGSPAIVMELVEGRTLEELLRGVRPGQTLPLGRAQAIARQIADGLEAAHEQGIVHRDLKPANIKVREDGVVKLLDFGLAKVLEPEPISPLALEAPTVTGPPTRAGDVVGTPAYMSPEQARGTRVDRRTDIWAFGCVLFELLSGRRAFAGSTTADLFAAIVHSEPDWSTLPADIPPAIGRLVRRALAKEEKQRLQSIGDARLEIEEWESGTGDRVGPPVPAARATRGRAIAAVGAAFLLGCALTAAVIGRIGSPPPARAVTRLTLPLPGIDELAGGTLGSILAVSPDGRTVVFVAVRDGVTQLYRRQLDEPAPVPIPGTEGAQDPFFSPDGTRVGFAAGGTLKMIRPGSDNAPTVICDAPGIVGGTWGPDDVIVFGSEIGGLKRVHTSGGTPEAITTPGPKDLLHGLPQFLPGGSSLVFYIDRGNDDVIATYSFKDRTTRDLTPGQSARYAPSGHLVVLRGDTLWAIGFDAAALRLTGDAVQLREQPRSAITGGALHFAFGNDGSLVYVTTAAKPENVPVWEDPGGSRSPLLTERSHYQDVALSPDGSRVALSSDVMAPGATPGVIWVYDVARRTSLRLSGGAQHAAGSPVWSPDGRRIAYTGWQENRSNLFIRAADATRPADQVTDQLGFLVPQFWTPDGTAIVFSTIRSGHSDLDLARVSLTDRTQRLVLSTPATESNATLSPDGRFMAYQSDESGRFEVHVRPFPDVDTGHWVVSAQGGQAPRWAPTGRTLYYRSGRRIMMVPVETTPQFRAGQARSHLNNPLTLLNDPRLSLLIPDRTYDVAANGTRLLILEDAGGSNDTSARPGIAVVQHWVEQLRDVAAPRK